MKNAPADHEARWAARATGASFGYKAHVAVDLGSGLVRKALLAPASVHDSILRRTKVFYRSLRIRNKIGIFNTLSRRMPARGRITG